MSLLDSNKYLKTKNQRITEGNSLHLSSHQEGNWGSERRLAGQLGERGGPLAGHTKNVLAFIA
jgi:hypothetical protein